MEKSTVEEASSPLATVDEIQKRLMRPPSLQSQPSTSIITSRDGLISHGSSQYSVNSTDILRKKEAKEKEVTRKRLEDYLDPVLLSAIRTEIGGKNKREGEMKQKKFEFEWPVDELKGFMEGSRTHKRVKWRSNEAVDPNDDDLDLIGDVGEEEASCTPLQQFERTALNRFKG